MRWIENRPCRRKTSGIARKFLPCPSLSRNVCTPSRSCTQVRGGGVPAPVPTAAGQAAGDPGRQLGPLQTVAADDAGIGGTQALADRRLHRGRRPGHRSAGPPAKLRAHTTYIFLLILGRFWSELWGHSLGLLPKHRLRLLVCSHWLA